MKPETIEEWNENVGVGWWKEGRKKLNKVIRKYNHWVVCDTDNNVKTTILLVKIYKNLKMSYCNQDGGSGWYEELDKMKTTVEYILKRLI